MKAYYHAISTLFLLLLFSGIIISCNNNSKHSEVNRKKTININLYSEPPTLDPRKIADTTSLHIVKMLFDGLMRLSPDNKPEFAIAKEVSISEDQKTYTFILRDAKWSNGDLVTAHDFEYTWKWILDPLNASDEPYHLYTIKNAIKVKEGKLPLSDLGVNAKDDRTLVVQLENPTPYFLELISTGSFFPIHKNIAQRFPDWANDSGPHYVSNGPFYLTKWKHNDEITVEKNPSYWDAKAVKLDEVIIMMISDSNTELNMFEEGNLDWAGKPISIGLPVEAIPYLKQTGQLHTSPMAGTYFYQFNVTKPPFNNAKIRKALAYALNRKILVENITQTGEISALSLMPPMMALQSHPYFQDSSREEAQKKFKEGLEELGITVEEFPHFTLSYNSGEGHHKLAQAVQQQWNDVLNIHPVLESMEWKVYLDKMAKQDFEVARMSWMGLFNDPVSFLENLKYTSAINPTGWQDIHYVELLNKAEIETNKEQRLRFLHEAEQLVMDQMPIVPVYFLMNSYLKRTHLKGVFLSYLGDIDFKWAYLEE